MDLRSRFNFALPKFREPFLAISHLVGGLLGVAGTIALIIRCNFDPVQSCVAGLYGITCVLVFAASTAFHGRFHRDEREADLFERFDYAAIYLFIAGTYTPVCLYALKPEIGIPMLVAQWLSAVIGCFSVFSRGPGRSFLQVLVFLLMGWGFLFAANSLFNSLSEADGICLLTGALAYSIGAVVFAFAPPMMFRGAVSSHGVWHMLVLFGASAHFFMIDGILRAGLVLHG